MMMILDDSLKLGICESRFIYTNIRLRAGGRGLSCNGTDGFLVAFVPKNSQACLIATRH